MSSSTTFKIAAAAFAVAGAFASTAHAAGFMLTEQTAGSLGRAYAGVGVDGTDVAGVYYNPATMTLHPGTNIQAGFVGVGLNLDYADKDGSTANGRFHPQAIPHGYITHQINDSTWVGLALTVPFGMGTDYDSDWVRNNRGIKATILTLDINPNLAWKVTDKISIGAGISLQYASADLKIQQNFMKSDIGQSMSGVIGSIIDKLPDGEQKEQAIAAAKKASTTSEIDADSWAWGFNVGVMWTPVETVRLGVSYRSKIEHNADGTLSNRPDAVMNGLLTQLGQLAPQLGGQFTGLLGDINGSATVSAPAWAMAAAAWDVNDLLSLYATFRWTDWSTFDELVIEYEGGSQPITNKWQDTYLFSVGADLRFTNWWTFRAGIGYETSAVDDPQYRTAIIPDADRWWFALGSSFKATENMQIDVSAAWLHGTGERDLWSGYKSQGGQPVGRFENLDAYLFGVQLVYKF